ncbi:hypothetical protein [Streptomyces sp. GESEQ-4]|uniref:hypothetical protein n=1 Tax=Streptomyces sp. GESEQ-4 TaxID=2812655 RepID=UPI001B32897C|nr:hypothetical protein [Streptomyces sp. GESEQ-4]
MNVEELLRDSLRGMAEEAAAPRPGLADRVLRTRARRRTRRYAGVITTVAAILAIAVAVPLIESGPGDPRPAVEIPQDDVVARPGQSPPRELIAAGDVAVSAYREEHTEMLPGKEQITTPVWRLYNPNTGRYEKTRWGWIAVAPGMQTAAVLERDFPVRRIGILDLATMEVAHWIPVDKGVAGVSYSADGKRLLATAYSANPDRMPLVESDVGRAEEALEPVPGQVVENGDLSVRTGFYVIDVESGTAEFADRPSDTEGKMQGFGGREDLSFSAGDPGLVWEPSDLGRMYYDLRGGHARQPVADRYVSYYEAGLSPDGKRVAVKSRIVDAKTGEQVAVMPAERLIAWVDDKRLIAWGCDPGQCNGNDPSHHRLLLVTVDSEQTQPLSGVRGDSSTASGNWTPVITARR